MKVGNVDQWISLDLSAGLVIGCDAATRAVALHLMSDGEVTAYVGGEGQEPVYVGRFSDPEEVTFVITRNSHMTFSAPEGVKAWFRPQARDQMIIGEEAEIFTTIEPRQRRNTEVDRMMQLMKVNELQRDRVLAEALAEVRASVAETRVADPAPEVIEGEDNGE